MSIDSEQTYLEERVRRQGLTLRNLSLPSPERESEELSIAEIYRVLKKRRLVIAGIVVAAVMGAILYSFLQRPMYESVSRISIAAKNASLFDSDSSLSLFGDYDRETRLETQVRVLRSDPIAAEVIEKLQLAKNRDFYTPMDGASEESIRQGLLGRFQSGLYVAVVPKTELIEIRYRSRSPELCRDIVTALVQSFIEHNFKVKYESTMQASDWLQKQLGDLGRTVEKTQERLAEFQKEHGVVFLGTGTDEQKNSTTTKLDELGQKLAAAQADRMMKEAAYHVAQQGNPELMAGAVTQGSPLQVLLAQQIELRSQEAQLSTKYGDSFPKLQQIRAQLKQVDTGVQRELTNTVERLKKEYLAAESTEGMLRAEMDRDKAEAFKLNESAVQYTILRREFESSRDLYESLTKKLKEAAITAGLSSTNITVVDPAKTPLVPFEPNTSRNVMIGVVAGIFFGLLGGVLSESLDTSIRVVDEVEKFLGLPSLAVVPGVHSSGLKSRLRRFAKRNDRMAALSGGEDPEIKLITLKRPKSQVSEAFRALRSSILLSSVDKPPAVLLVTSSVMGEGKSTTSINSAIVMAQKGGKVLLIDADLRRPTHHAAFKLDNRVGLSTIMTGQTTFDQAVRQCPGMENLYVLTSGRSAPYPAELLGSQKFDELIESCRQKFDAIIIDSPPVLSVTDAVVLSQRVDAVLLVVRWGHTRRQALRRTRDVLIRAKAPIVGVVVNAVHLEAADGYGYYYGYSTQAMSSYHSDDVEVES